MKSYRNAIAVLVLTLAFSTAATANAGIMYTEIAPPAPEEDDLTEIALTLLQTLIPLL